jgi:hypothetical protein
VKTFGFTNGGGNYFSCWSRLASRDVLLEQDPGLPRFFEELKEFLKNAI